MQGVGVREATLVILLRAFGVPKESAFTLGLLLFTHVVLLAIIGLCFQILLTLRPENIVSQTVRQNAYPSTR